MPAVFSTKEFVFNEGILSIYKNAKIEQFPFEQVSVIEVKKGSDLKRPKLAMVFGAALIIVCIKMLSAYSFDMGEFFGGPTILRLLAVLFFIGGIGGYAIYGALPVHPIIEIRIKDEKQSLSISSIIKKGSLSAFSNFLQSEFGTRFKNNLV